MRPEMSAIAIPTTISGRNMTGDDFIVTAGWSHYGTGDAVMPGQGRTIKRAYPADERETMDNSLRTFGETTFDVYLNDNAFWRNVPSTVWNHKLGGYQVLKKWLSYRESTALGRPMRPEEIQHFTDTARRIAAWLLAYAQVVN